MKPKKKRHFKRKSRFKMPSIPPPISINPWRRVTLSVEDEGNAKDKCVTVADIVASLKDQLKLSIDNVEIKLHRVRAWNRGKPAFYNAVNKVEEPAAAGPLCLNACDLVANMAKIDCSVTYIRTVESYPGRASWARVSHTWGPPSNRLIIGSNNDKAVVYTWRAPTSETVVFHISLGYRAKASGSFTESTLRSASGAFRHCDVLDTDDPASPFEKLGITDNK